MTMSHRPFQTWIEAPPWRVDYMSGGTDRLVISFSSVGHDPLRRPAPEFVASATSFDRSALFVSDESRSWGNAPGLSRVLTEALKRLPRPPAQIVTIGQSMGAFCALIAATILPVHAVLAFGPQFSVDPERMPDERRWSEWTGRIDHFRYSTAPLPLGPALYLFHGVPEDEAQALAFPKAPGLTHVLFPGLGHSGLVRHLKARGVLAGLLDAAFTDDRRRLLRIAASAGGHLRHRLTRQLPR